MLAHLVERDIRIVEVRSSSLLHSTINIKRVERLVFWWKSGVENDGKVENGTRQRMVGSI